MSKVSEDLTKKQDFPWWKKTTVYQIYPRSFYDSNGDGIGDLKGIISKLDYIKDLGVETIWFSPFYSSPQADFGYDISDFRNIAVEYGTMDTCDELIEEIHSRDMKIMMDMVLNHTSDQHPWFIESRSSRDNPKRDWYIWRDGKKPNGKAPPNNWRCMPGGSGWHYDNKTDQWYWAEFLPFQPDLNYRNPEVKEEMLNTVRFWLKKNVDAFRLDIIDAIYEDAEFRDNPFKWKLLPSANDHDMFFRSTKYTLNHPDTLIFMKELRQVIDEFEDPTRFMVGEVTTSYPVFRQYLGKKSDGLNLVFLFKSLLTPLKVKKFRNLIKEYEENFPDPYLPTWVFGNHDRTRRISRIGGDILKGKLNVALQLTVRGVPFIYYGEEIGMEQHYIPVKKSLDAAALKYKWIPQVFINFVKNTIGESLNRDECRTPMQWNSTPNAGFCPENIDPWLPVTKSYDKRNVAIETKDPDSILNCYKRFLKVRKEFPALNSGNLNLLSAKDIPKNLLGYTRSKEINSPVSSTQKLIILLNFSNEEIEFKNMVGASKLIVSTTIDSKPISNNKIHLTPWEGIVLQ